MNNYLSSDILKSIGANDELMDQMNRNMGQFVVTVNSADDVSVSTEPLLSSDDEDCDNESITAFACNHTKQYFLCRINQRGVKCKTCLEDHDEDACEVRQTALKAAAEIRSSSILQTQLSMIFHEEFVQTLLFAEMQAAMRREQRTNVEVWKNHAVCVGCCMVHHPSKHSDWNCGVLYVANLFARYVHNKRAVEMVKDGRFVKYGHAARWSSERMNRAENTSDWRVLPSGSKRRARETQERPNKRRATFTVAFEAAVAEWSTRGERGHVVVPPEFAGLPCPPTTAIVLPTGQIDDGQTYFPGQWVNHYLRDFVNNHGLDLSDDIIVGFSRALKIAVVNEPVVEEPAAEPVVEPAAEPVEEVVADEPVQEEEASVNVELPPYVQIAARQSLESRIAGLEAQQTQFMAGMNRITELLQLLVQNQQRQHSEMLLALQKEENGAWYNDHDDFGGKSMDPNDLLDIGDEVNRWIK